MNESEDDGGDVFACASICQNGGHHEEISICFARCMRVSSAGLCLHQSRPQSV